MLHAVSEDFLADINTPVSAYLKLCHGQAGSFLFESGESVDQIGRYSVVAWDPLVRLHLTTQGLQVINPLLQRSHPPGDFFDIARATLERLGDPGLPDLPFVGSLMGYVGYDAVRLMERLPSPWPEDLPVAELCFCSRFVVFDHLGRKLTLVALADTQNQARAKLDEIRRQLRVPLAVEAAPASLTMDPPAPGRFIDAVAKAKHYILEGDIFQVVLSEQFTGTSDLDPFTAYRVLRTTNPSPYMFFLDLGETQLAGASPETLVSMDQDTLRLRPIAGTRRRSGDPARDRRLERELMDSEKERAEHIMLVDLARNDAGKVCRYGTVAVDPYMVVERYSHVMHIVSQVTGRPRPEVDIWQAFEAAFPAGTVSGAPKVRAMEIIDELEFGPRGPYAGAVGRFGPGRRMDTCIAIRMIQFSGGRVTVQAGAGIVADSVPAQEFKEIEHKAAQGIEALRIAAGGLP